MAFRFISTEIIEDISFVLSEKNPEGRYLTDETSKFVQFITPGL